MGHRDHRSDYRLSTLGSQVTSVTQRIMVRCAARDAQLGFVHQLGMENAMSNSSAGKRDAPQFFESTSQLLDALKVKLGARSDAAVARELGVHRAAASNWRMGRTSMDPATALRAAKILELPHEPIILAQLALSERNGEVRAMYSALARMVLNKASGKAAALLVTLFCALSAPEPSHAVAAGRPLTPIYIMRSGRRLRRGALKTA